MHIPRRALYGLVSPSSGAVGSLALREYEIVLPGAGEKQAGGRRIRQRRGRCSRREADLGQLHPVQLEGIRVRGAGSQSSEEIRGEIR